MIVLRPERTNKMMLKMKWISMVLAVMYAVMIPRISAAVVAPLVQLQGTVEAILDVVKDESLSGSSKIEVRRKMMMELITERFDFEEMSKRTLGRTWKTWAKEEKDEFQKLFSDLLMHNYIGRVEAYSDEEVQFDREIFGKKRRDRAKVYTNILKNGHEIPINYSLIKKGEEWFVYDVVIEGVSLVRNYRTEFRRILNKEDFAGLVKKMQEKIDTNKASRNN